MLSDTELRLLKRIARTEKQPLSTSAYTIIKKRLRREA